MKAPKLIVVLGLPGSGKTTYLRRLEQAAIRCFDDFHGCAHNDSCAVEASRYWPDLVQSLNAGLDVVVSDIAFCSPARLAALVNAVKVNVTNVQIEYQAFENNPKRCMDNLINSGAHQSRIAALRTWAPQYRIPEGAVVMEIKTSHRLAPRAETNHGADS